MNTNTPEIRSLNLSNDYKNPDIQWYISRPCGSDWRYLLHNGTWCDKCGDGWYKTEGEAIAALENWQKTLIGNEDGYIRAIRIDRAPKGHNNCVPLPDGQRLIKIWYGRTVNSAKILLHADGRLEQWKYHSQYGGTANKRIFQIISSTLAEKGDIKEFGESSRYAITNETPYLRRKVKVS